MVLALYGVGWLYSHNRFSLFRLFIPGKEVRNVRSERFILLAALRPSVLLSVLRLIQRNLGYV